ncbi:iota toxin protein Ib, partial [Clostridioides difficile]
MNILIKTPTYFTNFDDYNNYPSTWSNVNTTNQDGLQGSANKLNGETKIKIPMSELKPYKRYVFSGYSKDPLTSNSIIVKIKAKEEKTDYLVPEQGYTKFSYEFETTEKDSSNIEITLIGSGTTYLDNLSITELNSTPEILDEPEVKIPTDQEIIDAHKIYFA